MSFKLTDEQRLALHWAMRVDIPNAFGTSRYRPPELDTLVDLVLELEALVLDLQAEEYESEDVLTDEEARLEKITTDQSFRIGFLSGVLEGVLDWEIPDELRVRLNDVMAQELERWAS